MRQGTLVYVDPQSTDWLLGEGLIGIYNDSQITFLILERKVA